MKYLNKFNNYLNESLNLDKETIKDSIAYLEDIADVDILEKNIFFDNKNRNAFTISINLSKLKKGLIIENSFERTVIYDDTYWEILNELITIKNRLSNDAFSIIFEPIAQTASIGSRIEVNRLKVHIILNSVSDDLLDEYYLKLNSKLNSMKTDFSYNTLIRNFKDDKNITNKIIIRTDDSCYTDRTFSNLIKGIIDTNIVNIEKSEEDGNILNIITLDN